MTPSGSPPPPVSPSSWPAASADGAATTVSVGSFALAGADVSPGDPSGVSRFPLPPPPAPSLFDSGLAPSCWVPPPAVEELSPGELPPDAGAAVAAACLAVFYLALRFTLFLCWNRRAGRLAAAAAERD